MTVSRFSKFINARLLLCGMMLTGLCGIINAQKRDHPPLTDVAIVEKSLHALTEVMIRDITAPPVASRTYVYSMIAFYEAARSGDTSFKSFAGRLNGLSGIAGRPAPNNSRTAAQPGTSGAPGLSSVDSAAFPTPDPRLSYDWMVAGAAAFHKTAHTFVFSKDLFEQLYDSVNAQVKKSHLPLAGNEQYMRSVEFGERVAAFILKWAAGDGYGYTRTLSRFTPGKDSAAWKQTGPDYMEAVEPHWDQIRSMTLASAHEYHIPEPAPFRSPAFVREYMEVYTTSKNMTPDQRASALFWDCNPYATQTVGHLMYSIKKISPAGHWMGIASIAIRQSHAGLTAALYTYSLVSIALFDGFIASWDEKYRTNYLRPITAIQQLYAPTWEPLLQTPPFPEYPSAHSVISMASATVLTALYGDRFHYTDKVEESFGLPDRTFDSFLQAAREAAMSRLYGGIHFREAVENGKLLGGQIGNHILQQLAPGHESKNPVEAVSTSH